MGKMIKILETKNYYVRRVDPLNLGLYDKRLKHKVSVKSPYPEPIGYYADLSDVIHELFNLEISQDENKTLKQLSERIEKIRKELLDAVLKAPKTPGNGFKDGKSIDTMEVK